MRFALLFFSFLFYSCFFASSVKAGTNIVANFDFENTLVDWKFGKFDRGISTDVPFAGSYYLSTSSTCANVPSDIPDCNTFFYDHTESLVKDQRWTLTFYTRSNSVGILDGGIWLKKGANYVKGEFTSFSTTNTWVWQKHQVNIYLNDNYDGLRLQFYLKNSNTIYQFDSVTLHNNPYVIAHKYMYWQVPKSVLGTWGGLDVYNNTAGSNVFWGWNDCPVCNLATKSADPTAIKGPEPWRRQIGTGDGFTYPYLGVYSSTNKDHLTWLLQSYKNAGIEILEIGLWPDEISNINAWGSAYATTKVVNDVFSSVGLKYFFSDEMIDIWSLAGNQDPLLALPNIKARTITALNSIKTDPNYFRINSRPVYFLPLSFYYTPNSSYLTAFNQMLTEIEVATNLDVYWLGYETVNSNFSKWGTSQIMGLQESYGYPRSAINEPVSTKVSVYSTQSNLARQYNKSFFLSLYPSFVHDQYRADSDYGCSLNAPSPNRCTRKNGTTLLNGISAIFQTVPRPVGIVIMSAEYQEGRTLEPAVGFFDDTSTDPYRYLRIISQYLTGANFTAPQLPDVLKVDPLRAGEIYGRGGIVKSITAPDKVWGSTPFTVSAVATNTGNAPWTSDVLVSSPLDHGKYGIKVLYTPFGTLTPINATTQFIPSNAQVLKNSDYTFNLNLTLPNVTQSNTVQFILEQKGFTTFGTAATQNISVFKLGDINGDNYTNLTDTLSIINRLFEKENISSYFYDTDNNNKVDLLDIINSVKFIYP